MNAQYFSFVLQHLPLSLTLLFLFIFAKFTKNSEASGYEVNGVDVSEKD